MWSEMREKEEKKEAYKHTFQPTHANNEKRDIV